MKRKIQTKLAAMMALVLAVPAVPAVWTGAAFAQEDDAIELPKPVAVYDFEKGFEEAGYDAEGNALSVTADKSETIWQYKDSEKVSGASVVVYEKDGKTPKTEEISNQPYINDDEEQGKVLTLQDTKTTKAAYLKEIVGYSEKPKYDAAGNVIIATGDAIDANGNKVELTDKTVTTAHSGATLQNPFAAYKDKLLQDVTFDKSGVPDWAGNGVTISYWVKPPKAADGTKTAADSSILSFETTDMDDVFNKDDAVKYEVAKMWRANPDDPIFSTGTAVGTIKVTYHTTCTPDLDASGYSVAATMGQEADGKIGRGWNYTVVKESDTSEDIAGYRQETVTSFEVKSDNKVTPRNLLSAKSMPVVGYVSGDAVYRYVGDSKVKSLSDIQAGKQKNIITFPTKEDAKKAYEAYCTANGYTVDMTGTTAPWGAVRFSSAANAATQGLMMPFREFAKYLVKGTYITGNDNMAFEVTTADPTNGNIEVTSAQSTTKEVFVVKDYGKYATFNPGYSDMYYLENGHLAKLQNFGAQNGLIKTFAADGSGVEVTDVSGNSIMVPRYSFDLGSCQSDLKYVKDANDTCALLFNTSGSWLFKENTEKYTVQTGNSGNGTYRTQSFNTNDANNAQATAYDAKGDVAAESVLNTPEEWHFVTYVIQNDKINTYYDGKLMDSALYHDQTGAAGKVTVNNQFNLGSGYRDYNSGVLSIFANSHLNSYGCGIYASEDKDTLGLSAYTMGMTVMELLTRDDTVLHIGGQTVTAEKTAATYNMAVGTAAGTSIDDLKFYIEPMDEEMVAALYKQELKADSDVGDEDGGNDNDNNGEEPLPPTKGDVKLGDVSGDGRINSDDIVLVLKYCVNTTSLTQEQLDAADVDKDGEITAYDASEIYKYFVGWKSVLNGYTPDRTQVAGNLDKLELTAVRNADETITVKVGFSKQVKLDALEFSLNFDETKAEVVSVEKHNAFYPFMSITNQTDGRISCAGAFLTNVYCDGTMFEVTLRAKDEKSGDIRLDVTTMTGTNVTKNAPYSKSVSMEDTLSAELDSLLELSGVKNADGTIRVDLKIKKGVDMSTFAFDMLYDKEKAELVSAQWEDTFFKQFQSTAGGAFAMNDTEAGKVRAVGGMIGSFDAYEGSVAYMVLRPKGTDAGEATLSVDLLKLPQVSGGTSYKTSISLNGLKEIIMNPDGSTTEKSEETITNPDGSTTEKTEETITNPDGTSESTKTETTTGTDGTLQQQIETLKKQMDALIKIVEKLTKVTEDIYNRITVTEKTMNEDGSKIIKSVNEVSQKNDKGEVIKQADVVDEKVDAQGVCVEKYEYDTQALPQDVEWKTELMEEVSQQDKSELEKRGAGENMELYDINPESGGVKVEPQTGSVRVSLHKGAKNWDETKTKVFDFAKNRWLDVAFEGDFITFEAEHFSQYAIVQLDHIRKGDADLSGDVTLKDAQTALRAALNIKALAGPDKLAADVDGDERVSLADSEKILKAALHIEELQ